MRFLLLQSKICYMQLRNIISLEKLYLQLLLKSCKISLTCTTLLPPIHHLRRKSVQKKGWSYQKTILCRKKGWHYLHWPFRTQFILLLRPRFQSSHLYQLLTHRRPAYHLFQILIALTLSWVHPSPHRQCQPSLQDAHHASTSFVYQDP